MDKVIKVLSSFQQFCVKKRGTFCDLWMPIKPLGCLLTKGEKPFSGGFFCFIMLFFIPTSKWM